MRNRRVFSVLLWTVSVVVLLAGVISAVSLTELVRFATITDNSSSPSAPSGSLEFAVRTPTKDVKIGDTILVGAHAEQGATLGQIADLTRNNGVTAVELKGSNRSVPDQWSYELGDTTYTHVAAIPLIGSMLAWGSELNFWLFAALTAALMLAIVVIFRYALFEKPERNTDHWFKRLERPERDDLVRLAGYFEERGLDAPAPYVKKKRRERS